MIAVQGRQGLTLPSTRGHGRQYAADGHQRPDDVAATATLAAAAATAATTTAAATTAAAAEEPQPIYIQQCDADHELGTHEFMADKSQRWRSMDESFQLVRRALFFVCLSAVFLPSLGFA